MSSHESSSSGSETEDSDMVSAPLRIRGPAATPRSETGGRGGARQNYVDDGNSSSSSEEAIESSGRPAKRAKTSTTAKPIKKVRVVEPVRPGKNLPKSAEFIHDDSDSSSDSDTSSASNDEPEYSAENTLKDSSTKRSGTNSTKSSRPPKKAASSSSAVNSQATPSARPRRPQGPDIMDGVFHLQKPENLGTAVKFFVDATSAKQNVWIISSPIDADMNIALHTAIGNATMTEAAPRGMKLCMPVTTQGGAFEGITECSITMVQEKPQEDFLPVISQALSELSPPPPAQPQGMKPRWLPIGVPPARDSIDPLGQSPEVADVPAPSSSKKEKKKKSKKRKAEAEQANGGAYVNGDNPESSIDNVAEYAMKRIKMEAAVDDGGNEGAHEGSNMLDALTSSDKPKKSKKHKKHKGYHSDNLAAMVPESQEESVESVLNLDTPTPVVAASENDVKKSKKKKRRAQKTSRGDEMVSGDTPQAPTPTPMTLTPSASAATTMPTVGMPGDGPEGKKKKNRREKRKSKLLEYLDANSDKPKTRISPPVVPGSQM